MDRAPSVKTFQSWQSRSGVLRGIQLNYRKIFMLVNLVLLHLLEKVADGQDPSEWKNIIDCS